MKSDTARKGEERIEKERRKACLLNKSQIPAGRTEKGKRKANQVMKFHLGTTTRRKRSASFSISVAWNAAGHHAV